MKWRSPGRRKQGRPKLTWAEGIRGLMGEKGLMEEDLNDRGNWRKKILISERESLPKQTTNHRRLESKHHRRNSGSDSGRTGKDFPKYSAPDSILSGRKCWPLPAHIMMSSHFLHNEVSPLQISLQYPH